MGAEAPCTLHFNGSSTEGKALLESEELVFRPREKGGPRLAVPLEAVRGTATADGGVLLLRWEGRAAGFALGPIASKWLEKIKNPRGRLDKLGVKPGQRVTLVGVLEDGFAAELAGKGATVGKGGKEVDLIFYAAERREALARLPALKKNLKENGAIWVIRPKGAAAISEADVLAAGRAHGLVDVKVVAFSATHTAEKLVIPVDRR